MSLQKNSEFTAHLRKYQLNPAPEEFNCTAPRPYLMKPKPLQMTNKLLTKVLLPLLFPQRNPPKPRAQQEQTQLHTILQTYARVLEQNADMLLIYSLSTYRSVIDSQADRLMLPPPTSSTTGGHGLKMNQAFQLLRVDLSNGPPPDEMYYKGRAKKQLELMRHERTVFW
ncbi:hypothetical protein MMC21_005835 [Puttea exsequens]|nr:hypothetical protein [Puttea exsequens]